MAYGTFVRVFVAAALFAAGLVGWRLVGFRSWEWHQQLVLEVETPRGIVSGGSVVAVKAGTAPKWLPGEGAGGMGSQTEGEASFLEIAPGRYLFALLGGETDRALTTFFPEPAPNTFERASRLQTMRETREVSRDRYPLLVTFADIGDPRSVKKVDPDNLAVAFGPGVTLKRITLEITDEGVTLGKVEKVLEWLTWPREKFLAAGSGSNPVQLSVDGGYLALGRDRFRSE